MLRFVHDALGTLDVDDGATYVTEEVEMPLPVVRDVAHVKADADGTWDQTAFVGARAVTLTVVALAEGAQDVQRRMDAIRAYLRPALRFALQWESAPGSGDLRRLTVRGNSNDVTYKTPTFVRSSVGLIAPGGVIESEVLHSTTILPAGFGEEPGRTYDLTFDRVYPTEGTEPTEIIVHNSGSADVSTWLARLYGPCTNPTLENVTVGAELAFIGLTLAAGEYVELDTGAHSALLNGNPALSVYDRLSPVTSAWWPLVPGDNRVGFSAQSTGAGAQAVIEWRDAWL